jgi:hypothetical protein
MPIADDVLGADFAAPVSLLAKLSFAFRLGTRNADAPQTQLRCILRTRQPPATAELSLVVHQRKQWMAKNSANRGRPGEGTKVVNPDRTRIPISSSTRLDSRLRQFIYGYFVRETKAPTVAEMARALSSPVQQIRAALNRLAETHAFVLQENGELWRAAPFSAVPTAFPVQMGKRSWYGNCIWDALGIPAMLHEDSLVEASCGCCNFEMPLEIKVIIYLTNHDSCSTLLL